MARWILNQSEKPCATRVGSIKLNISSNSSLHLLLNKLIGFCWPKIWTSMDFLWVSVQPNNLFLMLSLRCCSHLTFTWIYLSKLQLKWCLNQSLTEILMRSGAFCTAPTPASFSGPCVTCVPASNRYCLFCVFKKIK